MGALILILLALLPSLIYILTLTNLSAENNSLDTGSLLGSYFGLVFLILSYTAIGIFASILSKNQIVAFITAVFLCFLIYFGFEGLVGLMSGSGNIIEYLGIKAHYNSMSRGVLDTRDIIYFLSVSLVFIEFTILKLKSGR